MTNIQKINEAIAIIQQAQRDIVKAQQTLPARLKETIGLRLGLPAGTLGIELAYLHDELLNEKMSRNRKA